MPTEGASVTSPAYWVAAASNIRWFSGVNCEITSISFLTPSLIAGAAFLSSSTCGHEMRLLRSAL